MKILIDSADVEKIKEISKYREITGITTNPTILSKVEGNIKNRWVYNILVDKIKARKIF